MTKAKFAICTKNPGYEASLEVRKLYQVIDDQAAHSIGQIRVIDESGEDYLYPVSYFAPIDLPTSIADKITCAA